MLWRPKLGQRHTFGLLAEWKLDFWYTHIDNFWVFERSLSVYDSTSVDSLFINVNYTKYICIMAGRSRSGHLSNRCRYKDTTCWPNQRLLPLFRDTDKGLVCKQLNWQNQNRNLLIYASSCHLQFIQYSRHFSFHILYCWNNARINCTFSRGHPWTNEIMGQPN